LSIILYTSGTTGFQGVVLTNERSISAAADTVASTS
jgi:long-subunit acyl-CoA synthetase (AMP-forming)